VLHKTSSNRTKQRHSEADVLELICYLVAVVLFGLAAFNVPARVNLMAAGLVFAVFPLLVHAAQSFN
jgi:hypothetical protein